MTAFSSSRSRRRPSPRWGLSSAICARVSVPLTFSSLASCSTTVFRLFSSVAMRRRDASCWFAAASIARRSNAFIAPSCASTCLSSRPCSAICCWRIISSSVSSRTVASGDEGLLRRGDLLLVRLAGFDLADDRVDELRPRAAAHPLGHLLVVERTERLPAAAAREKLGLERALAHLLHQRAEECRGDEDLSLLTEGIILRRQRREVGARVAGPKLRRGLHLRLLQRFQVVG